MRRIPANFLEFYRYSETSPPTTAPGPAETHHVMVNFQLISRLSTTITTLDAH